MFSRGPKGKPTMHMTLDEQIREFAELWAGGFELSARLMAKSCKARYDVLWFEEAKDRFGEGWPLPGVPEADEATGWEGWYGDYADTGG